MHLQRLQWAVHISKLVEVTATQPNHENEPVTGSHGWPTGGGPCMVMKYLKNQSLEQLLVRRAADNVEELLPNRFLWSVFLCCKRPPPPILTLRYVA